MDDSNPRERRRHIRYEPEPGTFGFIDTNPSPDASFEPRISALVLTEAFGGCGLAVKVSEGITLGQTLRVKVGKQAPLVARVVWKQPVDKAIERIGFEYIKR